MKNKFENRIEEIMAGFEGIQPAALPPYFYTRLIARMEKELLEKKEPFFLLRPAILTTSLSVLLIFNIIFLFQFRGHYGESSSKQTVNKATIESFANAYDLNTTAVYE